MTSHTTQPLPCSLFSDSSRSQALKRLALLTVMGVTTCSHVHGFALNSGSIRSSLSFSPASISTKPPLTSTSLNVGMSDVGHLYEAFPLQSAVITCGVKASVADAIAQVRTSIDESEINRDNEKNTNEEVDAFSNVSLLEEAGERLEEAGELLEEASENIDVRRNVAYIIYGAVFVGAMCHFEYNIAFPFLFGTGHDWQTVVKKVLFDDFISGPWLWLPPAYFIKALMNDYPLAEGWNKYMSDVKNEGLLFKYWTIWIPAQSISFSVVPDHLRVAFMASVSFFWFILFSALSEQKSTEDEPAVPAVVKQP